MAIGIKAENGIKRHIVEDINPAIWFACVGLAYFLFTQIGLYFIVKPEGLALFWPASGLALAALLVNPRRADSAFAAIFIANVIGNMIGGNSAVLSAGFAIVNSLESLVAFLLIRSFYQGAFTLGRQSMVIGFVIISLIVTAFSAAAGAAMLHFIFGSPYLSSLYIWWVSDGLGIIMITPAVVSWLESENRKMQPSAWKKDTEAFLICVFVMLITWFLFPAEKALGDDLLFHRFAVYPLIVLLAVRHGRKWTFLSLILFSVATIWLSIGQVQLFRTDEVSVKMYFLDIQMFLIIANVTILVLASVVHERKVAATRVRKSEQGRKVIYEKTPIMMFSTDRDGVILSVSELFLEIMGYGEKEVVGGKMEDFLTNESRAMAVGKYLPQLLNSGHVRNFPLSFVKKNGDVVFAIVSSVAEKDYDGNVRQVMSVIVDITDKKLTEEELILSESRFMHLFNSMTTGFALHEIIVDAAGKPVDYRFLEVNPAFERLTGLKTENIIGKTALEIMPGTEKYWIEKYGRVALTGESIQFEDFSEEIGRYYEVTAYAPKKNQFAVIFSDVTEARKAEKEREQLRRQLTQSQKMEAIGSLAGGVAHEFNNMLGIIMGSAQLVLTEVGEQSEAGKDLQLLLDTSARARDLTRKLLTFARFDSPEMTPVSVKDIILEVVSLMNRTIRKDVSISLEINNNAGIINVDRNQIYQVLINLCNNAADAMTDGGELTISARRADGKDVLLKDGKKVDTCLIQVKDTGCGIDEKNIERVFEPFYTTKEIGRGTGLGLSVSHGIILAHGGSISFDSRPGKGTTVNVLIPIYEEVVSDERKDSQEGIHLKKTNKTILIIDDERLLLDVTKRLLVKMGYTVFVCSSGREGVALFKEKKSEIDIVVMDLVLPGEHPDNIFAELKAEDEKVNVLIASGYSEEGAVNRLLRNGACGFIPKPYEVEALCEMVTEALAE